ncbi:MAG TPA: glycoside hydrolase family 2 TIM barrel-domain containing protein, partial [Tepidisphaeraceae bacterium]|nr:glycoside hydrolase family 2 TIM barrel-domain containing protein [Tepidisphaeraceae bacterium]
KIASPQVRVQDNKTVTLVPMHRAGDRQPKSWTPATPNLYRLVVTLQSPDGEVQDRQSHKVGFRTFEIKGNHLYLNGKPYFLRGANQAPYGKNPWDPALARKYIQFMHDGNQRFTRTHATPWNEAWLEAADEIGLAVSIEGIRPWAFAGKAPEGKPSIMPPKEIFEHWLMENEDVVKRCRNHPSVFIFTVGNEMMLRDGKNMEKWKLMSEVTKQTRKFAPNHPIIVSSDYTRDPEFYEKTLKPAGIDDGDIDDMHRYNGWYGPSAFVINSKFEKEMKDNLKKRPLIGQEFATGYPDLDTGLPVLRYTRDLLTPQAWIGHWAYPGNNPSYFLDHLAVLTKRWAEQLRYQRGDNTSGFALFSSECWYKHSYDAKTIQPYEPLYTAVKMAWAPVGVALETPQRRFYNGAEIETNLYITNDEEQCRTFGSLKVDVGFVVSQGSAVRFVDAGPQAPIDWLEYGATVKSPLRIKVPADLAKTRMSVGLVVRVSSGNELIATTTDQVEIFPQNAQPIERGQKTIVIKKNQPLDGLAESGDIRKQIEAGATAIVFSPSKEIVKLFPDDLLDVKEGYCEFADWLPAQGTKLAANLAPMDLKWWARKDEPDRAYIATQSHRLKSGGKARELIRYIPPHGYIAAEKVPEQYRCVLSEIPLGKGRLWICDLDLDASEDVDPAANILAHNLYDAAADPESTKKLAPVPSHAEFLKGVDRTKMTLD